MIERLEGSVDFVHRARMDHLKTQSKPPSRRRNSVIWWPGTGRLRRSLVIDFRANWKRLNWDLHSVAGFWTFAFVFIWSGEKWLTTT